MITQIWYIVIKVAAIDNVIGGVLRHLAKVAVKVYHWGYLVTWLE